MSNLTNKFTNPFAKIKNNSLTLNHKKITIENSTKQIQDIDERRKMQVLSLNNNIRRSTDLNSHQVGEEFTPTGRNLFLFRLF
jgi:hypothetical protein